MNHLCRGRRIGRLSFLACIALAVCSAFAVVRAEGVKVGYFATYLPSEIEANIIGTIAQKYPELGIDKVEYVGTDVSPAWIGLQRGDIDVLVEVDLPNQQHFLDKAANEVHLVKQLFADAGQGFFVPRFAVEGDNAPATGLKSIDQLAKYKDVFGGKLYDESPGWQSTKYNEMRLKAYGLDFEHLKLADAALVAQVQRAFERKEPILFFFYHPHWLFQKLDVVKLDEPDEYYEGCFTDGNGKCPVPSFSAWIGARNDFRDRAPKFHALLSNIELSLEQVESLLVKIDVDKTPTKDAAEAWVAEHQAQVDEWVKKATSN